MTALAPLVAHHDVTWIASALSDEDRAVAAEGPVEETAHDGSRYRLRLVAHRPSAYDLYYNVVANPALWFVQHGLWELKHDPGDDLSRRLGGGLRRGEPDLRRRRPRGARARAGRDRLLPRLPPLRRAGARPGAAARGDAGPLHPHPVGGRRGLVGAARSDRDRDPHRTARQRRRRRSTPSAGGARFSPPARAWASTRAARSSRRTRSRSIRTSSRAWPRATRCSSASASWSPPGPRR